MSGEDVIPIHQIESVEYMGRDQGGSIMITMTGGKKIRISRIHESKQFFSIILEKLKK